MPSQSTDREVDPRSEVREARISPGPPPSVLRGVPALPPCAMVQRLSPLIDGVGEGRGAKGGRKPGPEKYMIKALRQGYTTMEALPPKYRLPSEGILYRSIQ